MDEIVSGPEAVSRLFEELREAIEVTYHPTTFRVRALESLELVSFNVRLHCVAR